MAITNPTRRNPHNYTGTLGARLVEKTDAIDGARGHLPPRRDEADGLTMRPSSTKR
jgi:hypothetical protein